MLLACWTARRPGSSIAYGLRPGHRSNIAHRVRPGQVTTLPKALAALSTLHSCTTALSLQNSRRCAHT
eukprot:3137090-Rhodomonas_salina.1